MTTEEMRGIPFDSKLQTAEDGSMYEDREIFSADIAEYFGYLSTNGVCIREGESLNNQLKITSSTAGVVVFNPGAIKIQGRMGWMEEAVEKQTEAGGTKPRYDTAVIELNLSSSERRFIPKIIKGVEADSPVPPTLTQTANIYQLGLANIYRAANSTALGTITDTRNDSQRCGISKVAVPNLPGVVPADLDPNTFISSGADLDDYTAPGTYMSKNAGISTTLSNCPFTSGGFVLFTQKTAYNNYKQVLLADSDDCLRYERRLGANSTWSSWTQVGTVTWTKIWENASPTSLFAPQDITISANEGDLIGIEFESQAGTADRRITWLTVKAGMATELVTVQSTSDGGDVFVTRRGVTITSTNSINFDKGYYRYVVSTNNRHDGYSIPTVIYVAKGVI